MFLELTFTDVDSLRDYLEHYSYKYGGERRWRKLFVLYGIAGCVKHPFIWYSPLTKEYHVDVRVNYRAEAYTRLHGYKSDKLNDYAYIVQWDSRYSKNSMVIRAFEDEWCWSDKAIQEILVYGDIYEKLSMNINVYEAKKYREYAFMFRIKHEKEEVEMKRNNLIDLSMVDGDTFVRVLIENADIEIKDGIVKVISDTERLIVHDQLSNISYIKINNREVYDKNERSE